MPDILIKCSVCGAVLDEEDMFCPNCGAEAPVEPSPRGEGRVRGTEADSNSQSPSTDGGQGTSDQGQQSQRTTDHGQQTKPATHLTTSNFTCRGCGASMSYDASAQTLRCPFCGSEQLDKKPDAKEISPDGVVPFVVTREQAVDSMRHWLGQGFWRPGDLATNAAVVAMTPIYVPYWVFDAETHTYWAADSSHTPPGARADWYPVCGSHEGAYAGLLVGASSALTGAETAALCPFDLSTAVPPNQADLTNITFERFTVPRKYARPLARQGLEALEAEACRPQVPGKCRNMNVNVRITNLTSRPLLVPVWIMAYRYREAVFRFLCNGQSGKSSGEAPVSYRKIGAAIGIAAAIILLILFWMFAANGGFRRNEVRWNRFSVEPVIEFNLSSGIKPWKEFVDEQSIASLPEMQRADGAWLYSRHDPRRPIG